MINSAAEVIDPITTWRGNYDLGYWAGSVYFELQGKRMCVSTAGFIPMTRAPVREVCTYYVLFSSVGHITFFSDYKFF